MKLNARPHRNGNTPDQFKTAGIAMSNALAELQDALNTVRLDVVTGRNYQHLPEPQDSQAFGADLKLMLEARNALHRLQELKDAILENTTSRAGEER